MRGIRKSKKGRQEFSVDGFDGEEDGNGQRGLYVIFIYIFFENK